MVKLEITAGYIGLEGHKRKGDKVVVDEARARFLIEKGLARVECDVRPAETKPAGPAETKDTERKKSSGAASTGLSTAAPSLSETGQGVLSSASPAAPASRRRRSRASSAREQSPAAASESSASTTRTE